MNPKLKNALIGLGICLVYIFIVWLTGLDWLYFGVLFILDAFFWHYVFYRSKRKPKKDKKPWREWVDAISFAVIAATIIRTFFFEAYTIPTPSMERSMMVGDFLFVSKMNYGPKIPNTPLSIPFIHNTIPGTNKNSYSEAIQWDYYRLPGWEEIENNDIVVFNWPIDEGRPVDKKMNYIKRCVGAPGDNLEIIDGVVHIDGVPEDLPFRSEIQDAYIVKSREQLNPRRIQGLGIRDDHWGLSHRTGDTLVYIMLVSERLAQEVIDLGVASVKKDLGRKKVPMPELFPSHGKYPWNLDNYGPLWIPKSGESIELDIDNIHIYKHAIAEYEGNQVEIKTDSSIFINGKEADSYTFKYNYYWMMGDNRHNSQDSRFWGFVPETHIVGKAAFIWMSWDKFKDGMFLKKIRWDRVFTFVHGEGKRHSLLPYFLVLVGLGYGFKYYKKKKAAKAS